MADDKNEYSYKEEPVNPRIEKVQNDIVDEALAYAVGEDADSDEIERFYADFVSEDGNYLVEGAVLTCDRATTSVKIIGGQVFNNTENASLYEKKTSVFAVSDKNASYCNGFKMATIKDHEKNVNIFPFKCNCEYEPNNKEELQAILANVEECKKTGTCQQLMKLENDWENLIEETGSFSFKQYNHTDSAKEIEDQDGITMMSMFFCNHGGIITPVRSGQTVYSHVGSNGTGEFVGYLAYGGKSITQDPEEGYYMLYDGPTVAGLGDCYMFADIYAKYCPNGYGALQGYGDGGSCLNMGGEHTTYGGATELDTDKGTLFYDGIERHAVAIGPSLQNPEFDKSTTEINAYDMAYGTCVDVSIELNGKTYYIPAVITDVKAHTLVENNREYSGYYQTNVGFDGVHEGTGKGQNIVEWYVRKEKDGKNKSTGLIQFDSNGGIIIYRDVVMD